MTKSLSSSDRKRLYVSALRQDSENRRYGPKSVGDRRLKGVPVDLRPDKVKVNALMRYIELSSR